MDSAIIDFGAARKRRAVQEGAVRVAIANLAQHIVARSTRQAERAFKIAGPLAAEDREAAHDIVRSAYRRLRAELRACLGKDADPKLQQAVLDEAEWLFRGRLWVLHDEHRAKERADG